MPSSRLVFGDFIESLRARGFTIGTGHYLRLQKLLSKVGPECKPYELKTLLCPIFATDESEQTRFYEEFETFFDFESSIESGSEATEPVNPEAEKQERRSPNWMKRFVLIAGSLLLLTVFVLVSVIAPWKADPYPRVTPTPILELNIPTPTPTPLSFLIFNNLEMEASTLFRILLAILPLIIFGIYEIYRRIKQRQRRREFVQPGIPIRFGASLVDVYDPDLVVRVARLLRARQRSGTLQLDIASSIAATVKALGFFSLREKTLSKPTEYLVLIERAAFRDHQARLFYELARKLSAEGVVVTCYFFEGDPRVSFISPFESVAETPVVRSPEAQQKLEEEAKKAQRGATLEDLHDLYPGDRLLIFGECTDLVDSITLQTVDWIKVFAHWQDRAILNPLAPSLWDAYEFALSQQFVVMPATLTGLELVAESFAIREPVSIPENLRGNRSRAPHDIDSVEDLDELRNYLGEPTFQWLCACAVHPQLQWDLTMCLGAQFSTNENLFTEENLLRLFSLKWFRAGTIPETVRENLVKKLTARNEVMVRHTIDELSKRADTINITLENAETVRVPPPQFAGPIQDEPFRLIKNIRDAAFKRFLQPTPLILSLKRVLPESLQRLLFTPFGLRPVARAALVLLVSAVLWMIYPALAAAFKPDPNINANLNMNLNSNINNNLNANVNSNANASFTPSPTPFPSPSQTPRPTVSPIGTPAPSPLATATVQPTPLVTPTIFVRPSPDGSPSPIPTFTASPAATITPDDAGIVRFELKPTTIKAGESATLSFYVKKAKQVRITPDEPGLFEWNKNFISHEAEIREFQGSAVVRPTQTTTYTITASIIDNVALPSFKSVSQQVTLVVEPKTGPLCDPSSFREVSRVVNRFSTSDGTITVRALRTCPPSNIDQWSLSFAYVGGGASGSSMTYDAVNEAEAQAIQAVQRTGEVPRLLADAIMKEVYPLLRSGDNSSAAQARMAAAIRSALKK